MHLSRRWGIIFVALAPLVVISPALILPVVETPIIGPLSAYPEKMAVAGSLLWCVGLFVLTRWRIRTYGKASIPRIAYMFLMLVLLLLVPIVALWNSEDQALGFLLIGLSPFIIAYLCAAFIAGIWATIALARLPKSSTTTQ